MNNVKPSSLAMLGGGVVLLIASFLDWQSLGPFSANAWDRGLLGFFLLVIAGVAIAVSAIEAFAPQVSLPDQVLGFTMTQLVAALGFAALLMSFGLLFQFEGFQIGPILAVLAAAAIVAGAVMEMNGGSTAAAEPPRTF